ncbi:hypothetical protein [Aquibium oceanicum]|uniref:Uncharacterized protein n=1 Tax=Aquibium oceanicum TaxID=1670800 RepID=A0A1L3SNF0_9HYPH|nr:hypothetical protein [Aquibium oceanicum]APH70900.1 hypothetical protein BSQ44_05540 [Aquibium oceanicum]
MQRLLVLKRDASKVAPATLASSGLTNHFAQLFVFKESGLWHTAAEGIFFRDQHATDLWLLHPHLSSGMIFDSSLEQIAI